MVRCEHLDAFSDAARRSMTDQEADSEEEGRSLPLPPNIDAQSDQRSNADSRACEADGGEMYPEPSASSTIGEQDEAFFGGPALNLDLEADGEEEMFELDQQQDTAEEEQAVESLAGVDQDLLDSFDEIVSQSMLSANLGDNLSLPWEDGIFKSIFSDESLVPMPEIPQKWINVAQSLTLGAGLKVTKWAPTQKDARQPERQTASLRE